MRDTILKQLQREQIESLLMREYGWDRHYGRPDKPFHKAECLCDQCLKWILANKPRATPCDE